MRWLLVLSFLAACGRVHAPGGVDAGRPEDGALGADAPAIDPVAGGDAGTDGCVPAIAPEREPPRPASCTVTGVDTNCDGSPELDYAACPVCPAVGFGEFDEGPCTIEGYACQYDAGGWCNFWGCDCTLGAGGELRWACWVPLC